MTVFEALSCVLVGSLLVTGGTYLGWLARDRLGAASGERSVRLTSKRGAAHSVSLDTGVYGEEPMKE